MHYKKRKLFALYSIPIWFRKMLYKVSSRLNLCNKEKLYLISYSIPLSCMVVLLSGFGMMINPSSVLKTNAIEVSEGLDEELSEEKDEAAVEKVAETSIEDINVVSREATPPSVTLEIGGAGQNEVVETAVDTVAYRSHMVKVNLNNVSEYFMFISGNTNLTIAAGGIELTGTGEAGVVGSSIPAGQWGYGWDYTGVSADEDLIYKTVPVAQTKLTVPELADNAAGFNGKLSFAAKFPSNATLGNYTSNVRLTLIASPRMQTGSVVWRNELGKETSLEVGTEFMQEIKSGFCKNNPEVKEGWTAELVDNRDMKTYTIYKAADGNCWMGQNLELTGPMTLSSENTDLVEGAEWDLPASVGLGGKNENDVNTSDVWDTSNNNVIQVRTGNVDLSGWKEGFGNYYSWPAATAGTGTTYVVNNNAAASICPSGWKMPTNTGTISLSSLVGVRSGWTALAYNGNTNVFGYYFGSTLTTIHKGANFWPAAGSVAKASGTLVGVSSDGTYWSCKASPNSSTAYHLYFNSSGADPQYGNPRYVGFPVRCVANY